MELIKLADTQRRTSRLGFGCSSLMGTLSRKQSLALLEAAFEQGIRHFDVAPMYGGGDAESCLGEFVARHRTDVTITTKFGLASGSRSPFLKLARRVAGRALQAAPALKRKLAPASDAASGAGGKLHFDASAAGRSLDQSLRNLRSDHIDLFLLHEAEAEDLCHDRLLRFLQDAQQSGKIGAFGVGSEAKKIPALLASRSEYCQILQFEWSVFDDILPANPTFRIHHRALSEHFHALHRSLQEDAVKRSTWSARIGKDVADRRSLAGLLLKASLQANPGSIILFSSKSVESIRQNAQTLADASLAEPSARLRDLVQSQLAAQRSMPDQTT